MVKAEGENDDPPLEVASPVPDHRPTLARPELSPSSGRAISATGVKPPRRRSPPRAEEGPIEREVQIHPGAKPDEADSLSLDDPLSLARVGHDPARRQAGDLSHHHLPLSGPKPERGVLVFEARRRLPGEGEVAGAIAPVHHHGAHRGALHMDIEDAQKDRHATTASPEKGPFLHLPDLHDPTVGRGQEKAIVHGGLSVGIAEEENDQHGRHGHTARDDVGPSAGGDRDDPRHPRDSESGSDEGISLACDRHQRWPAGGAAASPLSGTRAVRKSLRCMPVSRSNRSR